MSDSAHSVSSRDVRIATQQPGGGVGAGIAVAVLSLDEMLTSILNEVVTSDHTIAIAPDTASLAEQVLATNAGVVLVDADAITGDVPETLRRLRAQFPDLVLVAAGNSGHQARLANMVTEGQIYRFLHKPVSGQRVRLFVDAALRRYDELRGAAAELQQAQAAVAASANRSAGVTLPSKPLLAAGAVLLAILAWWLFKPAGRPVPAAANAPAAAAPANTLGAEQDKQLAALLDGAEKSIQANRLDEAAGQLQAAARIQPDNARLTFMATQIAKARERNALAQARSAAATGDYNKAYATLDAAGGADRTTLSEARRALSLQQGDERLRSTLRLGFERLRSGAVTDPANDSARFYAASARVLAPRDAATLRLSRQVQDRLLQEARLAATRDDSASMEKWLAQAREDGANDSELETVRRIVADARNARKSAEVTRLAVQVRARLAQDQLLEPANDSAQSWLARLRETDGGGAAAGELSQLLVDRMLAKARAAMTANDLESTQRWLKAAEANGGRGIESTAIAGELTARLEKQRRDNAVIGVNSLKRVKFVEPDYPVAAATQKVSGWVDMDFTVLKDGSVGAIQIISAQPGGLFDDAARNAVGKWRFVPVERDGVVVEQRVRMRLRFNAPQ